MTDNPEITDDERQQLVAALHVAIKSLDPTYVYNITAACKDLNISRPTIYSYGKRVREAGLMAIRAAKRTGRPAKEHIDTPKEWKVLWWQQK